MLIDTELYIIVNRYMNISIYFFQTEKSNCTSTISDHRFILSGGVLFLEILKEWIKETNGIIISEKIIAAILGNMNAINILIAPNGLKNLIPTFICHTLHTVMGVSHFFVYWQSIGRLSSAIDVSQIIRKVIAISTMVVVKDLEISFEVIRWLSRIRDLLYAILLVC